MLILGITLCTQFLEYMRETLYTHPLDDLEPACPEISAKA